MGLFDNPAYRVSKKKRRGRRSKGAKYLGKGLFK